MKKKRKKELWLEPGGGEGGRSDSRRVGKEYESWYRGGEGRVERTVGGVRKPDQGWFLGVQNDRIVPGLDDPAGGVN